jgi:hypothetical protein
MRPHRQDGQRDRGGLLRLSLGVCVAAGLLLGCGKPLDPDECSRLLDHYTELLVRQGRRSVSDEEVERLKAEARLRAAGSSDFSECSIKVSRRQWECAMKAPSVDEVERCLL